MWLVLGIWSKVFGEVVGLWLYVSMWRSGLMHVSWCVRLLLWCCMLSASMRVHMASFVLYF